MKTAGAMPIPARPRSVAVAALVVTGVLLVALGGGVLARGLGSGDPVGLAPARIELAATPAQDWGFVLRADRAQVLRHRPGLEPADLVQTHAFGWAGTTVLDVLDNPALMKELRLQRTLTPIDLVRLEARGA